MTATQRLLRGLEVVLVAVSVACLGYVAAVSVEIKAYQGLQDRRLDDMMAARKADVAGMRWTEARNAAGPEGPSGDRLGDLVGRIEIPRLGVSAVIRAGSDARTLRLAVGYIPGTALPGEGGNIGLAAHRDTFFRRLRDIRADDEIRIVTPDGTFTYTVERTNIVGPRDTWVLDRTAEPTLTLVTCYPFTYVGSAPQRFIVRAALRTPLQASAD